MYQWHYQSHLRSGRGWEGSRKRGGRRREGGEERGKERREGRREGEEEEGEEDGEEGGEEWETGIRHTQLHNPAAHSCAPLSGNTPLHSTQ